MQTAPVVLARKRKHESAEAYQRRLRRLSRRANTVNPAGLNLPYVFSDVWKEKKQARPKRKHRPATNPQCIRWPAPVVRDLRLQGIVPCVPERTRHMAQTGADCWSATCSGAAEHRLVTQRGRKARLVRIIG